MASETLSVKIIANASNFSSELSKMSGSIDKVNHDLEGLTKLGDKFKDIGAKMTLAGTAIVASVGGIVAKGSEWQSSVESTQFLYNNLGKAVQNAISHNSKNAKSIGLTTQQYKNGATNISTYYKNMGMTAQETAKLSGSTMDLVADLGAVADVPFDEALGDFKSALMGNYEAVDKYGVSLSASTLENSDFVKSLGKSWNQLSDNEKMMAAYNEITRQSSSAQGLAKQEANSFSMQFKLLKEQVAETAGKLGATLLPALTPLVQKFSEVAQKMGSWIEEHPKLAQMILLVIGGLGLLLATLGPILMIVGTCITSFVGLTAIAGGLGIGLGALAGIVGIVVGVIAGLIAIGIAVASNWDTIKKSAMDLGQKIKEVWDNICNFGKQAWQNICDVVSNAWQNICNVVSQVGGQIGSTVSNIWQGICNTVSQVGSTLGGIVSNIWQGICNVVSQVGSTLGSIVSNAWQGICNIVTQIGSNLGSIVSNVWKTICNLVQVGIMAIVSLISAAVQIITLPFQFIWVNCKDIVINVWNSIKTFLSTVITSIATFISTKFQAISTFISTILNTIKTVVTTVWNGIKAVVTTVLNGIKTVVTTIWNGIKAVVTTVLNGIKSVVTTIWNGIKSVVTTVLNGIKSVVTTIWNGIKSVITTVLNGIKSVVTTVWNGIKSVVTTVLNGIKSVVSSVWNSIKSVVSSVLNGIKSVVSSVWNSIKSVISNVLNSIKSVVSSIWNSIKSVISSVSNSIKSVISSVWNGIKSVISSITSSISSTVSSKFNAIKSTVSSISNSIKSVVSSAWNGIKSVCSSVIGSIHSTVSSKFNAIKNTVSNVISSMKSTVSSGLNAIKGVFNNCRLSFPKIKLPHFRVSGGFSIDPPKVPSFSIDWYSKGAIFKRPSVFGGIGVGDRHNGIGSGAEAILPIDKLPQLLGLDNNDNGGNITLNIENFNNNREQDLKQLLRELEFYRKRANRSVGGAY